jgi:hypothetical protein
MRIVQVIPELNEGGVELNFDFVIKNINVDYLFIRN